MLEKYPEPFEEVGFLAPASPDWGIALHICSARTGKKISTGKLRGKGPKKKVEEGRLTEAYLGLEG